MPLPHATKARPNADLKTIKQAVDAVPWSGRHSNALIVMRELLAVAALRGTTVLAMNERSIADRANLSRSSVHRALLVLRRLGFLKIAHGSREAMRSHVWRLCCPRRSHHTGVAWGAHRPPCAPPSAYSAPIDSLGRSVRSEPKNYSKNPPVIKSWFGLIHTSVSQRRHELDVTASHDAFSGPGGKTRYRVWAALRAGPRSVSEIALATACQRSTVRRHLRQLDRLELVARDGARMWRRGGDDLDLASELLGTVGAGDRLRARHARERQTFLTFLRRSLGLHVVVRDTGERFWDLPLVVQFAWSSLGDPDALAVL